LLKPSFGDFHADSEPHAFLALHVSIISLRIRMKSDIIYETKYKGALTQENTACGRACTAA
jgi:hypothetical protein